LSVRRRAGRKCLVGAARGSPADCYNSLAPAGGGPSGEDSARGLTSHGKTVIPPWEARPLGDSLARLHSCAAHFSPADASLAGVVPVGPQWWAGQTGLQEALSPKGRRCARRSAPHQTGRTPLQRMTCPPSTEMVAFGHARGIRDDRTGWRESVRYRRGMAWQRIRSRRCRRRCCIGRGGPTSRHSRYRSAVADPTFVPADPLGRCLRSYLLGRTVTRLGPQRAMQRHRLVTLAPRIQSDRPLFCN